MIYLSRLILDPRNQAVRRDLADCQDLHRTVLSGFPQTTSGASGTGGARERFGILHRVDTTRTGIELYVQSNLEPNWDQLPTGYLVPAAGGNPVCKRIDELYAGLSSATPLRFRLCANPTKRLHVGTGKDGWGAGKRVDLRREEDQLAWLEAKAQSGGFALCHVQANPHVVNVRQMPGGRVTGNRSRRGAATTERAPLTFGSVLFEGELRVTDPVLFLSTLEQGIGSGKAYGFGLLSIAPVSAP